MPDPAPTSLRPARVLVVDDERNIRTTLRACLEGEGCVVEEAATASAARDCVARSVFDLAFVDLRLGADDGLALLSDLLAAQPALSIVVVTAFSTVDSAVRAIRAGAAEYLPKPFTPSQVRLCVENADARRRERIRVGRLESEIAETVPPLDLDTASPAMRAALDTIDRAAASDATILLRGENGTGKSALARVAHARSRRRDGPFVTVSCPALSETLLESEFFGHARGAFTGADQDREGRVEAADRGTLFLDEIAEVTPSVQAKLLRFLQDRSFERVGETRTRTADVRLVAATNVDLEAAVAAGRFREDLLYRLNVIEVRVPALRERPEDIAALARSALRFAARQARRAPPELGADAEAALRAYPWPGNVRELRNAMERAVILFPGPVVGVAALPERMVRGAGRTGRPSVGGPFTLDELEREHLEVVLARSPSLDDAARTLGIDASTLWRKRKRFGI